MSMPLTEVPQEKAVRVETEYRNPNYSRSLSGRRLFADLPLGQELLKEARARHGHLDFDDAVKIGNQHGYKEGSVRSYLSGLVRERLMYKRGSRSRIWHLVDDLKQNNFILNKKDGE